MTTKWLAHYTTAGDLPVVCEYAETETAAIEAGRVAAHEAGIDPDAVEVEQVELHESRWDVPEDRWVLFGADYVPAGYDLAARVAAR